MPTPSDLHASPGHATTPPAGVAPVLLHRHADLPPVRRGYLILLMLLLIPPIRTDRPDDYGQPWVGVQGLKMVGYAARQIRQSALNPPPDRQLYESAVTAMMASVGDQYTNFLPARMGRDVQVYLDGGEQGDIGALLRPVKPADGGGYEIAAFYGESPAREAGLREGDRLVAVDGQTLKGLPPPVVFERLRGPPGTPLVVTYRRDGMIRTAYFRRGPLPDPSVGHAELLGRSRLGYVRVGVFSRQTPTRLREAVAGLRGQGMRGLIIDVRGNAGGELDSGESSADLFLSSGIITVTERRSLDGGADRVRTVRPASPDSLGSFPVAVLVDGETASAAELFAAALRENDRALLVGMTTFGKSAIQDLIPLEAGGAALRLTTGRFLTPLGRDIGGVGLHPDRVVSVPDEFAAMTRFYLERRRLGMAPPEGFHDPVLASAMEWMHSLLSTHDAARTNGHGRESTAAPSPSSSAVAGTDGDAPPSR